MDHLNKWFFPFLSFHFRSVEGICFAEDRISNRQGRFFLLFFLSSPQFVSFDGGGEIKFSLFTRTSTKSFCLPPFLGEKIGFLSSNTSPRTHTSLLIASFRDPSKAKAASELHLTNHISISRPGPRRTGEILEFPRDHHHMDGGKKLFI